jgi:hypothetical protein
MLTPKEVADGLMQIAARRSVESPFGWSCPDCEVLQEAARIVRGEPVRVPDLNPEVVLSGSLYDWQLSDDAKRRIAEINRHIVHQPGIR